MLRILLTYAAGLLGKQDAKNISMSKERKVSSTPQMGKTARKRLRESLSRRSRRIVALVILAALSVSVLAIIFGPKILHPRPNSAVAQAHKGDIIPPPASDVKISGKDYRVGKGIVLMQQKDPKTGDVTVKRVTIDDMLRMDNTAMMMGDGKTRKMVEDKILELGDQVVPELAEILACETDPILLNRAAVMLEKIGTDKAMSALQTYLKSRDTSDPNTQMVATNVITVIAGSGHKDSAAILSDIFLNGTTPADRAQAMELLPGETKSEPWFTDKLQEIVNNSNEAEAIRAAAIRLQVAAGDEKAADIGMRDYFSMKEPSSRVKIIWAIKSAKNIDSKEFFTKVCETEERPEVLMEALPAWFGSNKGGDPAAMCGTLSRVYDTQKDCDEIAGDVVNYLSQIGGTESVDLLNKIAAENKSEKIKAFAAQKAFVLAKDLKARSTGGQAAAEDKPDTSNGNTPKQ